MIRISLILISLFMLVESTVLPSFAAEPWQLKKTYESQRLIESPFFLIIAADINKNGKKEIIAADFGKFGDHFDEWMRGKGFPVQYYNLFVLEWNREKLAVKMHKQWDMSKTHTAEEKNKYFMAYETNQLIAWKVKDNVMVETIPPYLALEWINGKYVLREQQGWGQKEPLVGSWIFPWLSPSCYFGFPNKLTWPRECLVGIRDFSRKGQPKIITIVEEEVKKNREYKQTLHVRRFEVGFPVEWEKTSPKRFNWWAVDTVDRLNFRAKSPLLMTAFQESSWYVFEPDKIKQGYSFKQISHQGAMGIVPYDLPDVYLRTTQIKGIEEYWGYRPINETTTYPHPLLRKIVLKPDEFGFIQEDIDFSHHESFLGVGYFDVRDIDDDGLDEVILVEETGKANPSDESVYFSNIKDYIRILKWDGIKYQTMWASPPYTKRGTKFLVEDIKNTGKKQLIVLTPYGTVQIWERK